MSVPVRTKAVFPSTLSFDDFRQVAPRRRDGVGPGFTGSDPILPKGREFQEARYCFVNFNNSFFLNIAYFGAEGRF
jgi:hypothetical protein